MGYDAYAYAVLGFEIEKNLRERPCSCGKVKSKTSSRFCPDCGQDMASLGMSDTISDFVSFTALGGARKVVCTSTDCSGERGTSYIGIALEAENSSGREAKMGLAELSSIDFPALAQEIANGLAAQGIAVDLSDFCLRAVRYDSY